jgi:hypothetical protein
MDVINYGAVRRPKVLFQGSHVQRGSRHDPPEVLPIAEAIASELGKSLIKNGLDIILTGFRSLNAVLGHAAVQTCNELGIDPRERIRSYPYGVARGNTKGFGMVLEPLEKLYQEVRTFVIQECDALIAILGAQTRYKKPCWRGSQSSRFRQQEAQQQRSGSGFAALSTLTA